MGEGKPDSSAAKFASILKAFFHFFTLKRLNATAVKAPQLLVFVCAYCFGVMPFLVVPSKIFVLVFSVKTAECCGENTTERAAMVSQNSLNSEFKVTIMCCKALRSCTFSAT